MNIFVKKLERPKHVNILGIESEEPQHSMKESLDALSPTKIEIPIYQTDFKAPKIRRKNRRILNSKLAISCASQAVHIA